MKIFSNDAWCALVLIIAFVCAFFGNLPFTILFSILFACFFMRNVLHDLIGMVFEDEYKEDEE